MPPFPVDCHILLSACKEVAIDGASLRKTLSSEFESTPKLILHCKRFSRVSKTAVEPCARTLRKEGGP